jgi:transposase
VRRRSIPPERLLRAALLQLLYSIRSERQLVERLEFDLLFRWLVGLAIDEKAFDASSFSAPPQQPSADRNPPSFAV